MRDPRSAPAAAVLPALAALASEAARLRIRLQHVIQTSDRPPWASHDYRVNDCRNVGKVQSALEEGVHGHFVRRVEHDRMQAPGPRRRLGERETTELLRIRRSEIEPCRAEQVE